MKFILTSFFIFLFFINSPVYAENFYKKFSIKVSGIKIGELVWILEINNDNYSNDIKLESQGFLSAIYKFKGSYFSKGIITNMHAINKNNIKMSPIKIRKFGSLEEGFQG